MTDALPTIGAALNLRSLPKYRDWLLAAQRDLELQDFFRADVLDSDWKPLAAEVKSQLDGFTGRLGIHGPFWGFKIDSHDRLVREAVTKRLLQGLDVAEAISATQMVIHSPFTTWDFNNITLYPGGFDQLVERVEATLRPVIARAEAINCEIVIENIEDKDPMSRVQLAKALGSDLVRVSIDTGHAHYAHTSTGAPPVDYYVRSAGNLLAHVHLQDSDGYADRHWAPGDGTIRWASLFRAFAELTSKPRLVLELRDHDQVAKGAAYLTGLGLAR